MLARHIVASVERDAPLPDGAGDRFSGYAIIGLPFQSGHVLALRRFPASSIGPGYTAVWHRDPSGRWTFYSTVPPEVSCARYFGGEVERNVVTFTDIVWGDSMSFTVFVGTAIRWHVTLGTSLATRLLNGFKFGVVTADLDAVARAVRRPALAAGPGTAEVTDSRRMVIGSSRHPGGCG